MILKVIVALLQVQRDTTQFHWLYARYWSIFTRNNEDQPRRWAVTLYWNVSWLSSAGITHSICYFV